MSTIEVNYTMLFYDIYWWIRGSVQSSHRRPTWCVFQGKNLAGYVLQQWDSSRYFSLLALDCGCIYLAEPNAILSILSQTKSLPMTCSIIFCMNKSIDSGDEWCNHLAVLVCGIAWLRSALTNSQASMVRFNHSELLGDENS